MISALYRRNCSETMRSLSPWSVLTHTYARCLIIFGFVAEGVQTDNCSHGIIDESDFHPCDQLLSFFCEGVLVFQDCALTFVPSSNTISNLRAKFDSRFRSLI